MNAIKNFIQSKTGLWAVFILWSLIISHFWLPRTWSFYGNNDWDLTYSMYEVARKSIVEFGQWPQFNPWIAFGSDLNANPQAGHISIYFLPILIFGTFYGYKLSILMAMLLGCFGSFYWFRFINKDRFISVLLSLIFCSATYFSSHIFEAGHSNVLYVYLLPWLAFAFGKLRIKYKLSYFLLAVFVLAQMVAGGAPIVFLIAIAFMFFWIVGDAWIQNKYTLILPFIVVVLSAVLINLFKILPAIDLWQNSPRHIVDNSGINPIQWLQSLVGYSFRTGTWHAHYEYNLGFGFVLLGIIFYYRHTIKNLWKWAVLGVILIWFCMGNIPGWINPWYWLNHYIPPFNSLRAPSRFGIVIVLALCSALAFAIRNVAEMKLITYLLVFAAIGQGLAFHAESSFIADTVQLTPNKQMHHKSNLPTESMCIPIKNQKLFLEVQQNHCILNAYEPLILPMVTDTLPQLVKGGTMNLFTPNYIEVNALDTALTLNIRFSKNWTLFGPGELISKNGLIHIVGAKGSRIINYHNPLFSMGLWMGLLAIPILILSHLLFRKKA